MAEALTHLQASLPLYRELGHRHGQADTLGDLGTVYQQQGRWAEALASLEEGLAISLELGDEYARQGPCGSSG